MIETRENSIQPKIERDPLFEKIDATLQNAPKVKQLHGLLWGKRVEGKTLIDAIHLKNSSALSTLVKSYKKKLDSVGRTVVNVNSGRRGRSIFEMCEIGQENETIKKYHATQENNNFKNGTRITLNEDDEIFWDAAKIGNQRAVYETYPERNHIFEGYRKFSIETLQPAEIILLEEKLALDVTYLYVSHLLIRDETDNKTLVPKNAEELLPGLLPADKLKPYKSTMHDTDWNRHIANMINGVVTELTQVGKKPENLAGKKMAILRVLRQLGTGGDEVISGVYQHFERPQSLSSL